MPQFNASSALLFKRFVEAGDSVYVSPRPRGVGT